ncbi:hypothetical protein ACFWBX_23045 [Streptomyces sp. NPDC059991]|uniref:hypothetical protein n=1 Tax=Streptomyces sp. NPDC059991 TaxID=3347028 RepID=UPI00367913BB
MNDTRETAVIIGASRTLGLGLAAEYLRRGWDVLGTVRGSRRTGSTTWPKPPAGNWPSSRWS